MTLTLNTEYKVTGTFEYLEHGIVSQAPTSYISAASLVGSTVRLCYIAASATPSSGDWLAAGWVGTPTTEGLARTTSKVTFATPGEYRVYAEVTISTEVFIIPCRNLMVGV